MRNLSERISLKFVLFVGLAILLTYVPFIGNYVRIVNTLVHETGHALIALIGGDVHQISLFMNTEGVTYTSHSSWVGGFFTGGAGYVASSLMAFLAFWLISRKRYNILIVILVGLILLNVVLWVRNFYGIFWLLSFGAGFLLLLFKGSSTLVQNCLLLIASILLVESVSSAFTIQMLSFIQPHSAGDATGLARSTVFIPVQAWGVILFAQSLLFVWFGFKKGIYRID
ncbi:M50 family metallopeptidase [Robertmurraya andreesenii]|uniref:Signal transduction histidine kinase n=1 Tax=Anoxybacillus andreesenii TaxID=1325932 RepID=A0ABT9V5J5_9BACL|nr:M50 family metallopeptidase [Robertmurraya andreesenii]MDQ0156216.1 signal transduction histidine kinase [Robertmurraya andreesenii]